MPRVSVISKMPKELRSQLDKRLREAGYSNLMEHAEWLQGQGINASKSAVGRYSVELKAKDRASSSIAKGMRDDLSDREAVDLLLELGALRVKEKRILDRLEEIGYF